MPEDSEGKRRPNLRPLDIGQLLAHLQLGIGQAAELCGVSVRQLSYWTDKGIIQPVDENKSRAYGFMAVEKISLIKQALDQGFSLEGAVTEAEKHLREREDEHKKLESMSDAELEQLVLARAGQLQQLADRIRREVRTYRVSGDLGELAGALSGIDHLVAFFESNPYTINTARQIALRLGREVGEVERELQLLEEKHFIQRISYPGADVYRYVPQRR